MGGVGTVVGLCLENRGVAGDDLQLAYDLVGELRAVIAPPAAAATAGSKGR